MMFRRTLRIALIVAAIAVPSLAHAQGGYLWQGVIDFEGWKADSASRLLARGNGRPSGLARFDTWAAVEPLRNLIAFGEVLGEGGAGRDEEGNEIYLKQAGLRFTPFDAITVEAGKITQVVGTFSSRQLSIRNPLIGVPDGYGASYPVGARLDGTLAMIDYRAGVFSLPVWRDGYTPDPSDSYRPAAGVGITPFTGFRLGVSWTAGPYLNDSFTPAQLRNVDWKQFKERIYAWDAKYSRGYFEFNAEGAFNEYDIPGRTTSQNGSQYYAEAKYTFTPRLYAAARYERNDYPFIRAFGNNWTAANSVVSDGEGGIGYRATRSTLVKLSYRKDYWKPNPNPQAPHDNGYAFAMQVSQAFDVFELFERQ